MVTLRSQFFRPALAPAILILLLIAGSAFAGDREQLFLKANNHIADGSYDAAITLLMTVPEPKPNEEGIEFIKARMLAASLFHALEQPDRARAVCRDVLALFPDNTDAHNFLATLATDELPFYRAFFQDCIRFAPALLKGAVMTLGLTLGTMFISPAGGLFIALGRISGFAPVSGICWFIIWFFRGTPLLLQLFFIYYGLPSLGITLRPEAAAIIGLGLNYSAYLAEIIRAGIQSIPGGQMEAAKALGMSYAQAMRRIIVPQTYKRILPPVGNEFIALIKDTALVSTIAMVELMRSADQIFNTYFNVNVLIIAAMIYLGFTTVFTLVFERIERKVGAYENR
ncbi:MAG: ABC transporter permease subunit [Desulfobacterales bacterium]|nr:ABC transporter permease subunit [Desulfobacterales bacterium]